MEEEDVWEHRPDDGRQVADVEQGRAVPLDEEGDDRVAEEVEADKAEVVANDLKGVSWGCMREGFILFEDHEGFKSRQNAPEEP